MFGRDNVNGNSGFVGNLTLALIVLRLCGEIGWSWWWVLSPVWIVAVLGCAVYGIKRLRGR